MPSIMPNLIPFVNPGAIKVPPLIDGYTEVSPSAVLGYLGSGTEADPHMLRGVDVVYHESLLDKFKRLFRTGRLHRRRSPFGGPLYEPVGPIMGTPVLVRPADPQADMSDAERQAIEMSTLPQVIPDIQSIQAVQF